jgi:hypothetical protein
MALGVNRSPGYHSFIEIMFSKVLVEHSNIIPKKVGFARNAIFTD